MINSVGKCFGTLQVLDGFSLAVDAGERVCLLAPSGAGKSTLLRVVAGLDAVDCGNIAIDGEPVAARLGEVAMMPQGDAVFPFLTTRENLALPLKFKRRSRQWSSEGIAAAVDEMLQDLQLADRAGVFASRLSGGQRQRVVLARSLLVRPRLLLCDEPMGALDELTRQEIREVFLRLHALHKPTVLFTTHSVEEVVFISTKAIVCSGPPLRIQNVYEIRDVERNREWLRSPHVLRLREEISGALWQAADESKRTRGIRNE